MAENQVLFRLEASMLERLDKALAAAGFKTRNAWFREMVEDFIRDGKR